MKRLLLLTIPFWALTVSSPVAASVGTYEVLPSPNVTTTTENKLNSVSCVSSIFCMAVGSYSIGSKSQTLAMLWNGSNWGLVSSPNLSSTANHVLDSVSCASPTFCMAVGNRSGQSTLTMLWNGNNWTIVSSPDVAASWNYLKSVSCISTTYCMAVGHFLTSGSSVAERTLTMVWDGTAWSSVVTPNRRTQSGSLLAAVSCVSPTFCMAVGKNLGGQNDEPLAIQWDGRTWTLLTTPLPNYHSNLTSVSCVSSTFCMAVGVYSINAPLMLKFKNTEWTISAFQNVGQTGQPNAVVCSSELDCTATGNAELVASWTGTNWTLVQQKPAGKSLGGLSCVTSTSCMAVGYQAVTSSDITIGPITQTWAARLGQVVPNSPKIESGVGVREIVVKSKGTVASSKLTKAASLSVPKGAKITLTVSSKYKRVCRVAGTTVRTVGKGTCPVKVVVTTKSKKKTSKIVTIKVK